MATLGVVRVWWWQLRISFLQVRALRWGNAMHGGGGSKFLSRNPFFFGRGGDAAGYKSSGYGSILMWGRESGRYLSRYSPVGSPHSGQVVASCSVGEAGHYKRYKGVLWPPGTSQGIVLLTGQPRLGPAARRFSGSRYGGTQQGGGQDAWGTTPRVWGMWDSDGVEGRGGAWAKYWPAGCGFPWWHY